MRAARETAAQLDTAIDALLRQRGDLRSVGEGELTVTARLLRDALPRFHPRFSFEEHLAARLAASRRSALPAAPGEPTPISRPAVAAATSTLRREEDESVVGTAERRRRGLVAGGAIASGVSLAIPIAGAALVVWRRSRSSGGIL